MDFETEHLGKEFACYESLSAYLKREFKLFSSPQFHSQVVPTEVLEKRFVHHEETPLDSGNAGNENKA